MRGKNRTVEVFLGQHRVGAHGDVARLPVGGAHLAVLLHELERLDQSDDLINIAAHGKIVDSYLSNRSNMQIFMQLCMCLCMNE